MLTTNDTLQQYARQTSYAVHVSYPAAVRLMRAEAQEVARETGLDVETIETWCDETAR